MKMIKTNKPALMDVFNPSFVNHFFEEMMQDFGQSNLQTFDFTPKAEIVKNEDNFNIKVSLPGAKKEDMKISFDKNILTISGEKKFEHEEKKGNVVRSEFNYGKFSRSFRIDQEIAKDNIKAEFTDGVLHIMLPFSPKTSAHEISIG